MRVWHTGIPRETKITRLMMTDSEGFTTDPEEIDVVNGSIKITLPKTSAVVLKGKQGDDRKAEKDSETKHVSPLQKLEYLLH